MYFTIMKVAYSKGVYGCSGEYYKLLIFRDGEGLAHSISFYGLYGTDYRVAEAVENAGYKKQYASCTFGKIPASDKKYYWDETHTIDYIKNDFKHKQ